MRLRSTGRGRLRARHIVVAIAAAIAIVTALWRLGSATADLSIKHARLDGIPITVFEPASQTPAPAVVIAHGFAGSQQLMQPFAVTLARNGFVAVTFDFPGHALNPMPLPGGLDGGQAYSRALLESLDEVSAFARALGASDARLALLGHSMGADVVVRYARAHPEIEATVGVSLFTKVATATRPRNLLLIDGALEPRALIEQGYRIVGMAADGPVRAGVTYGSFADGTARRLALAGGVEHIGVLYSRHSMAEALAWMNAAFDRHAQGFLDARGPWLGLLYLGLIAAAWPLAQLLPKVASTPRGGNYGWRALLLIAIAPAALTPLILWRAPTDFLPVLLGDYLALHFALYGLLTAAGMWLVRGRDERGQTTVSPPTAPRLSVKSDKRFWLALVLAAVATAGYGVLAMGLPTDQFITSFMPGHEQRLVMVIALLAGTLPYFAADEWLTRGATAPRLAYLVTKVCFLASLVLAIALNLSALFFLIVIVPAILAFFIIFGLLSGWVYRRTREPMVGALANAVIFAWAIAMTFPLVSR